MDYRIVIALLVGILFGRIIDYALVRSGLTRLEWHLIKQTYRLIRDGKYKIREADDGSDH